MADVIRGVDRLLSGTGSGVIVVGANGVVAGFDPGAEEIFGYRAAEVIGTQVSELFDGPGPRRRFRLADHLDVSGADPTARVLEVVGRRKDGTRRTLDVALTAVRIGARRVFVGVVRDREAVREVAREFELRERAIDVAANGVTIADARLPDMPVVFVNEAFSRITGYAREEAVGRNCRFLHSSDPDQQGLREVREALAAGRSCTVLVRNYRKNGTLFWNELSLSPLADANGTVTHYVAIQNDVTHRRLAEIAQQESDARFRLLAENSTDLIARHDSTGRCLYVSPASGALLGYEPEELLGVSFAEIAHPDDAAAVARALAEAPDPWGPSVVTARLRRSDGRFVWFETTFRSVHAALADGGEEIHSTSRDVTDRKRAEEDLIVSNRRLSYLLAATPAVIYSARASGDFAITYMSPNVRQVLGYEPEAFTAGDGFWAKNIHPDDVPGMEAGFASLFVTGRLERNYRFRHADGRWVSMHSELALVRGPGGAAEEIVGFWLDDTARRAAEEGLRESEERYRSMIASLSEGIIVQDAAGRIVAANASAEQILGRSADDLLGRTSADPGWNSVHEDGSSFAADDHPIVRTLRTGEPQTDVVMGVERPDRTMRWISINTQPMVRVGERVPHAAVASFHDITEQREAEEALARNEARFRSLIERSSDMITLLDENGTVVYSSPSAERITGRSAQSTVGRNAFLFVHPDDRERLLGRFVGETAMHSTSEPIEFRLRHADRSWRVLAAVGTNLFADPNVRAFVVNSRDVTERRRAEHALRESEARSRALVEAIPDTFLVLDRQGIVLDSKLDPTFGALVAGQALLGRRAEEVLPLELASILRRHLDVVLEEGGQRQFDFSLPVATGSLDFEARLVDIGVDRVLVLVRDTTEQRQLERLKTEFVSVVSHELRTPLTSIRGALGLLAGGVAGELPAQARQLLDIATANSERLVRLINDILDIDKIESGSMPFALAPVDLGETVRQAVEANRALGEAAGVAIVIATVETDLVVNAEPDRLLQVLANLLSNAVKFSPRGGAVTVRATRDGGNARVEVEDRGPGIPAEFQPRVFRKFAQADSSDRRQKGGTGLGLAITKAIVARLGGAIDFSTRPGDGTTFFFALPLVATPGRGAAAQDARPRVLICEDNTDVSGLIQMLLEEGGYGSDVAGSAAEARARLAAGRYAAVTLDLGLPDADGLTLLRQLRSEQVGSLPPIVVVSASSPSGVEIGEASPLGINDWLEKPVSGARLLAAVAAAVACSSAPGGGRA